MRKIRGIPAGIFWAFKILWKNGRTYYFCAFLIAFLNIPNTFAGVLFPKYLLDSLTDGNSGTALAVILLFAVWEFLYGCLNDRMSKQKGICLEESRLAMKLQLMDKFASLRYEQLEDPGKQRQYEFSLKCIDEGDVGQYVDSVFSMISSCVVIGGIFYILRGLPLWVLAVMSAVIVTNAVVHIIGSKYTYDEMQEETPTERTLYYLRGRLMHKEYGKEIRSFRMAPYIVAKTRRAIDAFFRLCQRYDHKHNRILWWVHVVEEVQEFSLYAYHAGLFYYGKITAGSFVSNVSALFQFGNALNSIFTAVIGMAERAVYLQDYRDFLLLPSDYRGRGHVEEQKEHVIEFQDVSFRYPGQECCALEHIHVTIHTGERISIVGANGAGKTTFIKLLLGLYRPCGGKILLNGKDIEELDAEEYIKLFASVMQDYQLYSFRIIDNLLFHENETEEERSRAGAVLDEMGMKETLDGLAEGMDSFLTQRYSEKGIELSGGENQKLAISRALYRDAPVILLDEPTSALSPQSEYHIYQQFDRITAGKTVLYVSHRLASCLLCDRILVFDRGKIVEDGSHAGLMKDNGLYAEMFRSQSSLYGI